MPYTQFAGRRSVRIDDSSGGLVDAGVDRPRSRSDRADLRAYPHRPAEDIFVVARQRKSQRLADPVPEIGSRLARPFLLAERSFEGEVVMHQRETGGVGGTIVVELDRTGR